MKSNQSDLSQLPSRRKTHAKPERLTVRKKKPQPKHIKKKQSLIFKEKPTLTKIIHFDKKKNKKKKSSSRNPFILIRLILLLFIIMVVSLITYLSWMWFR